MKKNFLYTLIIGLGLALNLLLPSSGMATSEFISQEDARTIAEANVTGRVLWSHMDTDNGVTFF